MKEFSNDDFLTENKSGNNIFIPFILGICGLSFFILSNILAYMFFVMPSILLFLFICSFICNAIGFVLLIIHKNKSVRLSVGLNTKYKLAKRILIAGFILHLLNIIFYIVFLFYVVFDDFSR